MLPLVDDFVQVGKAIRLSILENWWPGEHAWSRAVTAVLVQRTRWAHAWDTWKALQGRGFRLPYNYVSIELRELEYIVREYGHQRRKARTLQELAKWWIARFGNVVDPGNTAIAGQELYQSLLQLYGIGPETASSILLYCLNVPIFFVDAYTKRILARHEWTEDRIRQTYPKDTRFLQFLHGVFVEIGKRYCKPSKAECQACPLRSYLPQEVSTRTHDV